MCYGEERQRGWRRKVYTLGGSVGCCVRVTQPGWHGDLPTHRDSKDCHPSALLGPGKKEKQPGPKIQQCRGIKH